MSELSFVDSTPLLADRSELLRRADEDGFLFFKRLLPRETVLALRAEMLEVVGRHGWRKPGQDPFGGLIDLEAINRVPDEQMRMDIGVSVDAYNDAQRLERLHAFPHHPRLVELHRLLFDRDVLVHPRHIARMITGHRCMRPTPPHQDFPLIQGTTNTWTCWIPIGDCPRVHGGLTVLRGSHRLGCLPIQHVKGAGGIAVQLCPGEIAWAEGDYEAGDIITFPSLTVHKALRCKVPEMIRLSLDVRYQPADQPVEQASLKPHCELSWNEIYAGWQSSEHQYYWNSLPLQMIPWNDSHSQFKRRIC
jgi:phytanoyl-CoA dioxygenase PhyH